MQNILISHKVRTWYRGNFKYRRRMRSFVVSLLHCQRGRRARLFAATKTSESRDEATSRVSINFLFCRVCKNSVKIVNFFLCFFFVFFCRRNESAQWKKQRVCRRWRSALTSTARRNWKLRQWEKPDGRWKIAQPTETAPRRRSSSSTTWKIGQPECPSRPRLTGCRKIFDSPSTATSEPGEPNPPGTFSTPVSRFFATTVG